MANKTIRKKKAYQKHCRDMVKSGRINDEAGNWITLNETVGICKNMHRDCKAGYKL